MEFDIEKDMYFELFALEALIAKTKDSEETSFLEKAWVRLKGQIHSYNEFRRGNSDFSPHTVQGIELCLKYGKNDNTLALREAQKEFADKQKSLTPKQRIELKQEEILNYMRNQIACQEAKDRENIEFMKYYNRV